MKGIRPPKLWTATALALVVSLIVPWAVLADTFVWDGDVVTIGNQTTVNLGTVSPGATIIQAISFQLQCAGKQHVDEGQTVGIAFNLAGSTVPLGGSLAATDASIGAIPLSWPDDTTGGGSTNCPSPAPLLDDNGNSSATITAPTTPGSYTFVVVYSTSLSPGGSGDPQAITGPNPSITFNLLVQAPSDTTPPSASPSQSPAANGAGWNNTDVTVTWNWTDNPGGSGIDGANCTTSSLSSGEGTIVLNATCKDLAGNTGSASYTVKVDKTAPTISTSVSPDRPASGWWNIASGAPTVSFICSDATSGIDSCPTSHLFGEGVDQAWSGTAYDKAGNSASAGVSDIDVDLTAPTASASASPAPNANGWNNTDVTVSFSGSDGLSGIDSCSAPVTLSNEGAGQSASGTCTDKAGNVSAPAVKAGINIDKTPPTFGACPAGGPFLLNSGPQSVGPISVNAAISGLNAAASTLSGSVDTSSVGTKSVTFKAVDNADNEATKTCSYSVIYKFLGFFQPIDMGMVNTVKGGSTVPVKWKLQDATGTDITDVSAVASGYPKALQIDCTSLAAMQEDAIETTATGGTILRYDFLSMQFIYNWQTPKKPGMCYRLDVKFVDGVTQSANFKLK